MSDNHSTKTSPGPAARLDAYRSSGPSPTKADAGLVWLPALDLELGGRLEGGHVAYRTSGEPHLPAVAVLGSISDGRDSGWWRPFVGPGRAVDTSRFHVITMDWLGGCNASTHAGGLPRAAGAVPLITPRDQAAALNALLDALGITRLHACIGACYGGMTALALAANFHAHVARVVVLGAAHEPHPMASALRAIQRDIVHLGNTAESARTALVLARTLDLTTARSAQDLAARFTRETACAEQSPVLRHLRRQAECCADRLTAEAFLCLSQSQDLHSVDPRRIRVPVTAVAFDPDVVAPVWQVRSLVEQLAGIWMLRVIRSRAGHDAFREETTVLTPIIADALSARVKES